MRITTQAWAKFESKGRPLDTKQMHGTTREILLELAKWVTSTYMGSHMRITIARTESELIFATQRSRKLVPDEDMADELDMMLFSLNQGELLNGQDQPDPHMPESKESLDGPE